MGQVLDGSSSFSVVFFGSLFRFFQPFSSMLSTKQFSPFPPFSSLFSLFSLMPPETGSSIVALKRQRRHRVKSLIWVREKRAENPERKKDREEKKKKEPCFMAPVGARRGSRVNISADFCLSLIHI